MQIEIDRDHHLRRVRRQIANLLGATVEQCFHWSTHSGAELDLLVLAGSKRYGFEVKRTEAPRRH